MKKLKDIRSLVFGISLIFSICVESYAIGSISGTLTDTGSQNVSDAFVMAFLDGDLQDSATSAADGTYSITGLEAGTYEIHILADGYEYRIETNVVVIDDNDTTQNVTNLAAEGIITGKLTRSNQTTPIDGVVVIAYHTSGLSTCAITNENGNYSIGNLPDGDYTVEAQKPYYTFSSVENIEVTSGETTSDVDLTGVNGNISGKITESDQSTAIQDAVVTAIDSSGNIVSVDSTDSSGDYELAGLATATYTIEVRSDAGLLVEESSVSVTDGQTTTKSLSASGGSISGTVTNSSQSAIQGAILTAVKDGKIYQDISDSSGDYKIERLSVGTYEVTVDPNSNNYVASKIINVNVVSNQETSNQDFTLTSDGKISGTITNSSQEAIEGAFVVAIEPDDAKDDPSVAFIPTTTDSSGNYTISHLRSGTYTIFVQADNYVSDSQTGVSVTASQTTSGKDFTLGTSGGTISGTVYESDGETPIEGAVVIGGSDGVSSGYTFSDSSGNYSLTLLQAGTYTVHAHASGYELETLNNIVATVPNENSGNDFTLDDE